MPLKNNYKNTNRCSVCDYSPNPLVSSDFYNGLSEAEDKRTMITDSLCSVCFEAIGETVFELEDDDS